MASVNFNFKSSSLDLTPEEYFAEYRAQLAAHKASLEAPVDAEDDGVVVVQAMTEVDPPGVKRVSPKRYIQAALGAGFEVRAAVTKTFERGAIFKSGDRAGQRRPDKEIEHLWIVARAGQVARFKLHFTEGSFSEGLVWDAAGWPIELWTDYTPSTSAIAQQKDEPERAWKERVAIAERNAARQDAEYNDGEWWTNRAPRLVKTSGALEEWLADLVPGFEPRKPAARTKQSEATAADLLQEGEWTG